MSDLIVISEPTHEPVIIGDFVHLASGSPLGLVTNALDGIADVTWLTSPIQRSRLPLVCLRPLA